MGIGVIPLVPHTDDPCIGLLFRGYRNFYRQGNVIECKQGIRVLKRRSCPGCSKCGWLLDEAGEFISNDGLHMPEIVHGALYRLEVTNVQKDWETGIVDDYDLEIVKVTDPNSTGGE